MLSDSVAEGAAFVRRGRSRLDSPRMRILLLNPPAPSGAYTNRDLMGGMGIDDGFGVGMGPRFVAHLKFEGIQLPVVSLGYAAAVLGRDDRHEVVVLDQARQSPETPGVLEAALDLKPDWVVGVTSLAYLGTELRHLERIHEETGAQRMLVGYAATHFAGDLLSRGLAEVVCSGDPEIAFGHLAAGTLAPGTPGVLMAVDGEPVPAGPAYASPLDALPHPDWTPFPIERYRYFPLLKRRPFLSILSSRGCPYACNFCPYPIGQGKPFRARAAEDVVDEMQRAVETWGVQSMLFRDPTFSLDMERVKSICRLLLERGVDLEWGIETRLDRMDDEMITLLGQAGCRSAEFGIDPIDEQVRSASRRKGIPPERAAELVAIMEDNGIATAGLAVIGLPESSEDEMRRTIDWVQSLRMSYVNYELATPFPGTPLYDEAITRGWAEPTTLDDLLEGDPKLGFNGVIDLDAMRALQDDALRRFYVRPGKVVREVFGARMWQNVAFMVRSSWTFMTAGRRPGARP